MPGSFMDVVRYPDLDMTEVFEAPEDKYPIVVCENKDDAIHLWAYMTRRHHDYCAAWEFPETRWRDDDGRGTGYRFIRQSRRVQYCSAGHYYQEIENGRDNYFIIPFDKLLCAAEIEESDMSLETLMGV